MKKLLEELYVGNGLTLREIASQFGVDNKTIQYWLIQAKIPRRKSRFQKGNKINAGKRSGNWKGGRTVDKDGYILIYIPEHPRANGRGYVFEHRLVMEKILGRYLTKEERIHHNNGIINDNRLGNLRLFSSFTEHIAFHKKINK